MGPPPSHDCAFNRCATRVTRLSIAAKHLYVHVLETLPPFSIDIILETGAAVGDAPLQDLPTGNVEPFQRGQGQPVRGRPRAHSRLEERLIDINVAEAGHALLIEEDGLHGRGP